MGYGCNNGECQHPSSSLATFSPMGMGEIDIGANKKLYPNASPLTPFRLLCHIVLPVSPLCSAVMDAGELPSASEPGQYRLDRGHAVVLDGLCRYERVCMCRQWG